MWERDNLKRKAVITKDESDWVNFKTEKNRTKETWKGINSILSKAKGSIKIPKIVVNGTEISDPEAISNAQIRFSSSNPYKYEFSC
jgi:glutaredoxin